MNESTAFLVGAMVIGFKIGGMIAAFILSAGISVFGTGMMVMFALRGTKASELYPIVYGPAGFAWMGVLMWRPYPEEDFWAWMLLLTETAITTLATSAVIVPCMWLFIRTGTYGYVLLQPKTVSRNQGAVADSVRQSSNISSARETRSA